MVATKGEVKQSTDGMIYQSNAITDGVYKLTLDEARLINLAISKINKKDLPDKKIRITAREFLDVYMLKDYFIKNRLSSIGDNLTTRTIDTFSRDSVTGRKTRVRRLWVSKIEYDIEEEGDNFLEITFSPEISELIFQLKGNFTEIELKSISSFSSPHTFRVYAWLCKYKKLTSRMQNGCIVTDKITVDDFKLMLGIDGSYAEYKFLKRNVLDKIVTEINASTDTTVLLNEFKTGRKVTSLSFTFVLEAKDLKTVDASKKPERKRLPSRPKAKSRTHLEGEWARECISILVEYEKALKKYDDALVMPISDLEKLVNYYKIIGDVQNMKKRTSELTARRTK